MLYFVLTVSLYGRLVRTLVAGLVLVTALAAATAAGAAGRNGAIVFSSNRADDLRSQLISVALDGTDERRLTERESWNDRGEWSPDAKRIAFTERRGSSGANPRLVVMNADGSGKSVISDPRYSVYDLAWSPDGTRVAYYASAYDVPGGKSGIYVSYADGSGTYYVGYGSAPSWSADGREIATTGAYTLVVHSADGSVSRELVRTGRADREVRAARWAPDGSEIAYAFCVITHPNRYERRSECEIRAIRPDGSGDRFVTNGNYADWSPDASRLAVVRGYPATSLVVVNRDGGSEVLLKDCGTSPPSWSRDGRQLAFLVGGTRAESAGVFVVNADGTGRRRVTTEDRDTDLDEPAWSPDGTRILYSRDRNGNPKLYRVEPDGSGLRPLTDGTHNEVGAAFSPDGRTIAFSRDGVLYLMNGDGMEPRRLASVRARATAPAWSPDGTRIAFEGRRDYLYVVDAAGGSRASRLTRGSDPHWSPDGKRIVFLWQDEPRSVNWDLYTVAFDGTGKRKLVEADRLRWLATEPEDVDLWNPAWSPDGKTILFSGAGRGHGDTAALFTVRPDGSRLRLIRRTRLPTIAVWSPDGRALALGYGDVVVTSRTARAGVDVSRDRIAYDTDPTWQPLCTISGTDGGERLAGARGSDLVCGLGGDDRIRGGRGRDQLFGHDGNDVIFAVDGRFDAIGCGAGNDVVRADARDLVGVDCERVRRR